MPASLSSITSQRATLLMPVDPNDPDGDRLKIVYKPKVLSTRIMRDITEAVDSDDELAGTERVLRQFCKVVVEWDLRTEPGDKEPIPLTPEGLEDVPLLILRDIFTAINDDQSPDPTTPPKRR